MKIFRQATITIFLCLAMIVAANSPLFEVYRAEAQSIFNNIGGKITMVDYCCNGMIISVDYENQGNGGDFFLGWADIANPSVTYSYYQVFYGGQQPSLGLAFPIGFCVVISSECEESESVEGGTIIKIGTGYSSS